MKHFVFVGASSGLGKVTADLAEERGHAVSVLALGPKKHERHYVCDVTVPATVGDALNAAVKESGAVGGLAFFQRYRGRGDEWDGEIETQLTGTRRVLACAPSLFPGAPVVLVSSASAFAVTSRMGNGYHVAKAGLVALARYYAALWRRHGVRVNCVCPGTFLKPENEAYYRENKAEYDRLCRASPLGRMLTARQVAKVILFLLSDESDGVTGQSWVVDGGVGLRWQEDLVQ